MKYLDPKNDLTFKRIFGGHKHLCKSFLNALLPLSDNDRIVELEYLPAELVPEIPVLKNTIVDVRCTDIRGRQFIVEMQMFWTESFKQRVLFNASKAYVKQLDKKEKYNLLQPVYALSLVDDIFEPNIDNFYHHYQIVNLENTDKQLKGLEFVFVELPKFRPQTVNEKKIMVLWLRFMTEINEKTTFIPKELTESGEIKEAIKYLQESAFTKEELEHYDKYWDQVRVERTMIDDAYDAGQSAGLIKGELLGMKKGELLGIKKGELLGIKKGILQVAKKMKDSGKKVSEIAAATGLTEEEIRAL